MEKLKNIIAFFCQNYPYPQELSKARLVKMLYLADWKNCIENNKQLTTTKWVFNQFGPYVINIIEELKTDNRFEIIDGINSYGSLKQLIKLKIDFKIDLTFEEKEILNFVINATSSLNYSEFIDLIYSTYPIKISSRMSELNLVELANEYKSSKENRIYA